MFGRIDNLKLALGSGTQAPDGWYGLDLHRRGPRIRRADLLLGIPAATGTVEAVLAEHILEHLYLDDVPRALLECRRILRRDGIIRVVSPDAAHIARLLQLGPAGEDDPTVLAEVKMHRWDRDGMRWARTVNRLAHQWGQHRSLLTGEIVSGLLAETGFRDIEVMPTTRTRFFDGPPDIHPIRFPDELPGSNFAVEARAPGSDR
jgi:predicted SAM-dependent methyltransferase